MNISTRIWTLFASLLIFSFAACQGNAKQSEEEDSVSTGDKPELQKKITKRDLTITRNNAYNDLFLDSMNLEQYITEYKVNDTIARRMRSFYNARNYQFAWFSSDGLTEQARGFWNIHEYQTTYASDSILYDKTNTTMAISTLVFFK